MSEPPGGGFENIPLPGMPSTGQPPPPPPSPPSPRPEVPTSGRSGAELPHMLEAEQASAGFKERAFSFVTGRPGAGALGDDPRAQLMAAFGASPRDPNRPNVAAAAKALKVTPRSVQRWLAGGGIAARHREALRTRSRQALTTKRGRARVARAAGPLRPARGSNALRVSGDQGVVSGLEGNYRMRDTKVQVRDEDLDQLQALWVEHGEAGFTAFLHQHFDTHYEPGWHIRSVEEIGWDSSTNYRPDL